MNLDELRSVQAKERRKDSLQHLRDAFYDDVADYISDLRDARDGRAERVENPFSDDDVRRLSDEIETAEEVAEALYERRVGKVVKLASFAAADMPVEREGMTSQERALFEDLVARIEQNKSSVLHVLSGTTATGEDPPDATPNPRDVDAEPTEVDAEPHARPDPIEEDPTDAVEGDSASRPLGDEPSVPPAESSESPGTDAVAPSETDAIGSTGADTSEATGTDDGGMLADAMTGSDASSEPDGSPDQPPADVPNDGTVDGDDPDVHEPAREPHEDTPSSGPDGTIEESSADTAAEDGHERTTVRIKRDVGTILGVDEREYDLESEDVVRLPSSNAEPLLARDAAERIE